MCLTLSCAASLSLLTAFASETAPGGFTNIIANGDAASSADNWSASGTATGSTVSRVQDSTDASNYVIRFDGTSSTGSTSQLNYKHSANFAAKTYYYSFRTRLTAASSSTQYLYFKAGTYTSMSTEWTTVSGINSASSASFNGSAYITFKMVSASTGQGTTANQIPKTSYEVDDLVMYDLTDAVKITAAAAAGTSVVWEAGLPIASDGAAYAMPGSTIKFTVEAPEGSVPAVSFGGSAIQPGSDGSYSINVSGNAEVSVTIPHDGTTLANIITYGDFETTDGAKLTDTVDFATSGCPYEYVLDPALSGDAANHVLKISPTSTSGTVIALRNLNKITLTADHKYFMDFEAKFESNLAIKVRNSAYGNLWTTDGLGANTWKRASDVITSTANNPYTYTSGGNTYMDIMDAGATNKTVPLYLDNLVLYDVTNAYNITTPAGVELDAKYYAQVGKNKMTNAGDTVKFSLAAGQNDKLVFLNGTQLTADADGIYSFTMPEADALITLAGLFSIDTDEYGTPYLTSAEEKSLTVIAAEYASDKTMSQVAVGEKTTLSAGTRTALNTIPGLTGISDWSNKRIYIWDDINNLTPLTRVYGTPKPIVFDSDDLSIIGETAGSTATYNAAEAAIEMTYKWSGYSLLTLNTAIDADLYKYVRVAYKLAETDGTTGDGNALQVSSNTGAYLRNESVNETTTNSLEGFTKLYDYPATTAASADWVTEVADLSKAQYWYGVQDKVSFNPMIHHTNEIRNNNVYAKVLIKYIAFFATEEEALNYN